MTLRIAADVGFAAGQNLTRPAPVCIVGSDVERETGTSIRGQIVNLYPEPEGVDVDALSRVDARRRSTHH